MLDPLPAEGLIGVNRYALLLLIEQMLIRCEMEIKTDPNYPRLRVLRSSAHHLDRALRDLKVDEDQPEAVQEITTAVVLLRLEGTALRWLSPSFRGVSDASRMHASVQALRTSKGKR